MYVLVWCVYACVYIYMCIKFLIHNTYRLRLLIVPYVKASSNWTSQVLSVNELLPNYHGILAHKHTHTHACSQSLSLFAFSFLYNLSFYPRVCDLIIFLNPADLHSRQIYALVLCFKLFSDKFQSLITQICMFC